MYLIIDGVVTGRAGGQAFTLCPGSWYWLNQGEKLDMVWPARLVFTEVWFRLCANRCWLGLDRSVIVAPGAWDLLPVMRLVEDEVALQRPAVTDMLRHLLAMLMVGARRLEAPQPPAPFKLTATQRSIISRYAREHVESWPTTTKMAELVGLTPDYFSRLFQATYRCSPRQWLVRERVLHGARLLRTSTLPIHEIGSRLGYIGPAQFSRQFKSVLGATPKAFRFGAA